MTHWGAPASSYQWRIQGGPKWTKIFLISCSFWENLYVGASPWRVCSPSYWESWIRPCLWLKVTALYFITARKRSLQRLCFYTCLSFCSRGVGGGVCLSACWDTIPSPGTRYPLHSACWEIRSTSGRYASYWNAILFHNVSTYVK